jgi:hypothetical protein
LHPSLYIVHTCNTIIIKAFCFWYNRRGFEDDSKKIKDENYVKEFQLETAVAPGDGVNEAEADLAVAAAPPPLLGSSTKSLALI